MDLYQYKIKEMYIKCDLSVKDIDEKGVVTKYVNAFGNEDSDGDISKKGSFKKTLNESFHRVKWFLNHDTRILLGVPLEAKEDNTGLLVRSQLNMKKQVSRDILEDYKLYAANNRTLEHSIGVNPVKRDNNDSRIVTEWKLWEYSTLTNWGSNEMTPAVDIKCAKDIQEQIQLLEQMLKGKYSDERLNNIQIKLKELKTLVEPDDSTHEADFDPLDYLKNNLTFLKNG